MLHTDPGRLDIKNKSQRTIIKGEFQALLFDISAEDGDEKKFLGIAFESEAFDAWYVSRSFDQKYDGESKTPKIDIRPSETTEFSIHGLGRMSCTTTARLSSKIRSSSIKSATILKIEFDEAKSINEVLNLCFGLESLFGFLIGFRGRYPIFTTWVDTKINLGEFESNYDGTLEIGNVDWVEGEAPHPMRCVHLKDVAGGDLQSILEKFLAREKDFLNRIHAVEFSRLFSRNLNDQFAVVMPILENHVQRVYKTADEESYITAQAEFFAWIDSSPLESVREFPKKHVEIKNKKTPGLQTLLTRAIEFLNTKGFCFDTALASRIQKRRGALFHAAPEISNEEVMKFYSEVNVATALLLLHTLSDLGIDISYLAERYHALGDFRAFLKKPPNAPANADLQTALPQAADDGS